MTSSETTDVERAETLLDRVSDDPAAIDTAEVERVLESSEPYARQLGLQALATAAPQIDDVPFALVGDCLTDDNPQVRDEAIGVLVESLSEHFEQAREFVPQLITCLDDEFKPTVHDAIVALTGIAQQDPNLLAPATDRVIEHLDSDRSFLRKAAVEFLAAVVPEHPDEVKPATPRFVELIGELPEDPTVTADWEIDEGSRQQIQNRSQQEYRWYQAIRETSALVVAEIATADPDTVRPHLDDLRAHLDIDNPAIRGPVIDAFTAVGEQDPNVIVAVQSDLVAEFEDDSTPVVRAKAARALAMAAEEYPTDVTEDVVPEIESVFDSLDHASPQVRGAAVSLLAYVAEHRPDAVEPVADDLRDLLDDPQIFVRGNAAWTLSSLGDDYAADAISALEDDPEADLRQTAEEIRRTRSTSRSA